MTMKGCRLMSPRLQFVLGKIPRALLMDALVLHIMMELDLKGRIWDEESIDKAAAEELKKYLGPACRGRDEKMPDLDLLLVKYEWQLLDDRQKMGVWKGGVAEE